MILADLKNTPLLQSCHKVLLEELARELVEKVGTRAKKKGMTGNNFRAITRLGTLATQAMFLCLSVS